MQFFAYHWKVVCRAVRVTWAQFQPSLGAVMRGALVTAFIWLMLLLSDVSKLAEKLNEAALLAVAMLLAFPVVFVWNWVFVPSEIDGEMGRELAAANDSLARIASRKQTQEWLIAKANDLRILTEGLEKGSIESARFLREFDSVWQGLITILNEGSAPPVVIYQLQNVSSHSTLAPSIELITASKARKLLNVAEEDVDRVVRCFSYVNNLDAAIAQQGNIDG